MIKRSLRTAFTLMLSGALLFGSCSSVYADTIDGTKDGTGSDNTGETSVINDLEDSDIIDKDAKGSMTIKKYDFTSADNDGIDFNYSDTDHDYNGTQSTMTYNGATIDITSDGTSNADAERVLAPYAIKGVQFTYLKVGDVKTLNDVNADGVGGDIELIYGIPDDLEDILTEDYLGTPAASQDSVDYYTSGQITDAYKARLEDHTSREDGDTTVDVKDELEEYIIANHGTAMADTDENGMTSKDNLDLGLYLVVETKVPENVTDTVNPWFVQIPMTTIDGESWMYDITCYPKNQTGHPTLDKLVRNEMGQPGDLSSNTDYSDVVTTDEKSQTWVDDREEYTYQSTVTASEADVLDFLLVSRLPATSSTATYTNIYQFVDNLSVGLTYNKDARIAIYSNEADAKVNDLAHAVAKWQLSDNEQKYGETYADLYVANTSEKSGTSIKVDLSKKGLHEINTIYNTGEYYLVVYYTATVNSDATAVLGDEGNPNDVSLVWQRTNSAYYNTLEDETIVYSYGLDLTKTFEDKADGTGNFKNVSFVLFNETDKYYVVAEQSETDGLYYMTGKTTEKGNATEFHPSASGRMVINGLEADTYKLTETKTDKGYTLGQNEHEIVITRSSREITASAVRLMTQADDVVEGTGVSSGSSASDGETSKGQENSYEDKTLVLANGSSITSLDEGTTDKDGMVVGNLTEACAKVADLDASMENNNEVYGSKDSSNAAVKLSIKNEKGFNLPKTGGAGILGLIGVAGLFILAGFALLKGKKNTSKNA